MEGHLSNSLMKPTGKFSDNSKNTFYNTLTGQYSTRFMEDYVFHKTWKFLKPLDFIGFTVNPEYCNGIQ